MPRIHDIYQTSLWNRIQKDIPSRGGAWELELPSGAVFVTKQKLPMGRCWLSIARGPLGGEKHPAEATPELLPELLQKLAPIAAQERAVFLRIDPPADFSYSDADWQRLGFRSAHASYQPRHTLIIDLKKSEEEILADMKQKGRYNIKVAEKHGVTVKSSDADESVAVFYDMLKKTASRDGFSINSESYYKTVVAGLAGTDSGGLLLAYREGKPIAGMILALPNELIEHAANNTAGATATYLYGASDHESRQFMAPYLLQWEAIKMAKAKGFSYYDFLGIAPTDEAAEDGVEKTDHAWAGVTSFKKKFGGTEITYPEPREYVYDKPLYWLMRAAKSVRHK